MDRLIRGITLAVGMFSASVTYATAVPSLNDDGSNVVVGGLVLIFIGFFIFMAITERKLARLEKDLKQRQNKNQNG